MPGSPLRPSRLLHAVRRLVRNDRLVLAVLGLVVGATAGAAVVAFREAILVFQDLFWTTRVARLVIFAQRLAWWQVLWPPVAGGLLVGLAVHTLMPGRRPHGVADVIEASVLGSGRMDAATGLKAALLSALSIGAGASVGREGPAVHLGAALAGGLAERLRLPRGASRTLLGCGAAAAVAASFNAPIAGALFAAEVVLGHYAPSAVAALVLASVAGTGVSRAWFGDFPAFTLFQHSIASAWEFPAFVGLGLTAGMVAVALVRGIGLAAWAAEATRLPGWARPALGGLVVGAVAIPFPQVLGIGYGTVEVALRDVLPVAALVAILGAKLMATSVSLGFGFAGGVFSPSLVLGALLGGAVGGAVTALLPHLSSGADAYAIVGMGAVASAVLAAPVSTTLIVFEMTGNYALTLAVMVAVVAAGAVARPWIGGSFFIGQLARRGLDLEGGAEKALLRAVPLDGLVRGDPAPVARGAPLPMLRTLLQCSSVGVLFVVDEAGAPVGTITLADLGAGAFDSGLDALVVAADVARPRPPAVARGESLDAALTAFRAAGLPAVAVVGEEPDGRMIGSLHACDVMEAHTRALMAARRDERSFPPAGHPPKGDRSGA